MSEALLNPRGPARQRFGDAGDLAIAGLAAAVVLAVLRFATLVDVSSPVVDLGVCALAAAMVFGRSRAPAVSPRPAFDTVAPPPAGALLPDPEPAPVEHAEADIGPIVEEQPVATAEPETATPPDRSMSERVRDVAGELFAYGEVTQLLGAQIDASVEETAAAALTTISNLQALDQTIETLLRDVRSAQDVSGLTIARGQQAVGANATLVSNLRTTILNSLQDASEDRKTYEEIANEANVFASALDSIARIAKQTRFLALNATVEAVRAGGAGQGFALIAAEIRSLADAVGTASDEVREGLQRLRETTNRRMKQKLDAVDEIALLDDVEAHSRAAVAGFEDLSRHQSDTLAKVQVITQHAAGHLMSVMAETQVQDIVRQRLGNVKTGLDRLGSHAALLGDGLLDETLAIESVEDTVLETMRGNYVMKSEHDVHARRGAGGADTTAPATLPAIELF